MKVEENIHVICDKENMGIKTGDKASNGYDEFIMGIGRASSLTSKKSDDLI